MIQMEYIVDKDKSLLTIMFHRIILKHMKVKVNDYLNFYQSAHKKTYLTLFKADTGYRITRMPTKRRFYQILVRHPLEEIEEFELMPVIYYLKKNNFIKIKLGI